MHEWLSYRLADFLMFSPRVYHRQFELHNEAVWPFQILALALSLVLVWTARVPSPVAARMTAVVLGAAWLSVGGGFLWQRYAEINWAADYIAPLFGLEGLALLIMAVYPDGLALRKPASRHLTIVMATVTMPLVLYPLLAPLFGRPWHAGEVFGIAPDPTALGTLAILSLSRLRVRLLLMIVPAAWCIITALTLWTLRSPEFWPVTVLSLAIATSAFSGRDD